jgi:hypothetical protein
MEMNTPNPETAFDVLKKTLGDAQVQKALAKAYELERLINFELLSDDEISKQKTALDATEWLDYYCQDMAVMGLFRRVNGKKDIHGFIELEEPEFRDEIMESQGFYFIPDPILSDDHEIIARQYAAGLYFRDTKGRFYVARLDQVEVGYVSDEQVSEQRLRAYHPEVVHQIDKLAAEHHTEEDFVLKCLPWLTLETDLPDDLVDQYVSDVETYLNGKVLFDHEIPYQFTMSGTCTRILDDGSQTELWLTRNEALVKPERIRFILNDADSRFYTAQLELTQYGNKLNGYSVRLRIPPGVITQLRSVRRHLSTEDPNL